MSDTLWRPSATNDNLRKRASLLSAIRQFFAERQVLEVETPLMCQHSVTDPHVVGIPALYQAIGSELETRMYLQTSPEYAMKRLLVAELGSIYQISKAFRQGEVGRIHNPEFSMLEWYRLGFDHHDLMDEMDALLQRILKSGPAERMTYQAIYEQYLKINPHTADEKTLARCVQENNIPFVGTLTHRNDWLYLLWTHYIEPLASQTRPLFVYDFPATQSSLARIRQEAIPVASRFEVYYKGIELANGFHELQDAKEQESRFRQDLSFRQQNGLPERTLDEKFLAALSNGLPDCAGVALGVDRLMMLALGCDRIADVISFPVDRA